MLTVEEIRDLLNYDPDTGVFIWRNKGGRRRSAIAGSPRPDGYIRIYLCGKLYYAHRLAWVYVYGVWPALQIDHVNCDPTDNRIANLREATSSQNRGNKVAQYNSASGVKGVHLEKRTGRWVAYISPGGKRKTLGTFNTLEEAKACRAQAARELFGEFSRD